MFPAWIGLLWWRTIYFGTDRNILLTVGITGIFIDMLAWIYVSLHFRCSAASYMSPQPSGLS